MAGLTNTLEQKIRALHFGNQLWSGKPTTLYLAFGTALTVSETEEVTFTEVNGSGYSRPAIASTTANWLIAGPTAVNRTAIRFPAAATADIAGITHWALFTAATRGTMLVYGSFKETRTIAKYATPNVVAGELSLTLAGACSTWMANKTLAYLLHNAAWTPIPTFYVGVGTNGDADQLYGEPIGSSGSSATGYARGTYANTSAKWPASTANPNTTASAATVTNFPDAVADWGQLTYQGLLDAAIVSTGATYAQSASVITVTHTGHGLSTPQDSTFAAVPGTYSRAGNTITIETTVPHLWAVGQRVYADFSAGTGGTATDGSYLITAATSSSITVTDVSSGTITDGTVNLYRNKVVDLWFTSTSSTYPVSRRYYVVTVPSSSTYTVEAAADETTQTVTSGQTCIYSAAHLVFITAMTSAIQISANGTTTVPAGAMTASFD